MSSSEPTTSSNDHGSPVLNTGESGQANASTSDDHRRRQALEQKLKSCPTDRDSFLELAELYRKDGLPLHASRVLKDAHEVFPDDDEVLWQWEEAQLERSVQQLVVMRQMAEETKSIALDHDLERCHVDWANCRLRICRARLKRQPERDYLRLVLGEALYDLEQYDDALDELQLLTESDTHGPAALLLMGRCHLVSSRDLHAMQCLRAASIRRAVVGAPKVRQAALRLLVDLADRHGMTATLEIYRQTLDTLTVEST
ncbi:MAG: hypothetical protein AAGJ40_01120 [Planctomycetota bacterium]